jgi:uncharacterized protein YndB with AHSA1/START domain
MTTNTVSLHRVVKAYPEKVYRAFTEANALAFWIAPYGFLCSVHELDVRIGGTFRMTFHNFSTGIDHSFGGEYLEIAANQFLKYTDIFDDLDLPGKIITSVWLKMVPVGTDIKIIQENVPSMIPLDMCYLGWQESLEKLAKLVEPEITDHTAE